MHTLRFYFAKLAKGTVAFQEAEKNLPNTPEKAYFSNSEEMCFSNFSNIESGRLDCTKPA